MVPTPPADPDEIAKAKKALEDEEAMGAKLGFDREGWEANAADLLKVAPEKRDEDWYKKIKWLLRHLKPEGLAAWKDLLGFLSIWFKLIAPGKYGWVDGGEEVEVVGHVTDVHRSTDGFISLDIDITGDGSITFSPLDPIKKHDGVLRNGSDHAYVRIEINPKSSFATDYLGEVPKICQWVRIRGPFKFDRDGHYEVHPKSHKDIEIIQQRPIFPALAVAFSEAAVNLPRPPAKVGPEGLNVNVQSSSQPVQPHLPGKKAVQGPAITGQQGRPKNDGKNLQ
ncbi:MAG: hypothetical protein K8T20_03870 [Planctomycetes bacterium]|nr:hypothetical protein [Planctomycetota bacterium]